MRAWTIGEEQAYDDAIDKSWETGVPITKTGKGGDPDDPDYEGGWVWDNLENAKIAAHEQSAEAGYKFAVYELDTDGKTWEQFAFQGRDGEHHLSADAVIVGKAPIFEGDDGS